MIKFGHIVLDEVVIINSRYFLPEREFDLYQIAGRFRWFYPEANWDHFVPWLAQRGLGKFYQPKNDGIVVLCGVEEGKVVPVRDPEALLGNHRIKACQKDADNRTFQLDHYHPLPLAFHQLMQLVPGIEDLPLSSLKLSYLASGLHHHHWMIDTAKVLDAAGGDLNKLLTIAKDVEIKLSTLRTQKQIAKTGFAINGKVGYKEGDENLLYTAGLCTEHGFELFCRAKLDLDLLRPLLQHYATGVREGKSLEELNQTLLQDKEWSGPKAKAALSRKEKIPQVFTYRIAETFDVYQLAILA